MIYNSKIDLSTRHATTQLLSPESCVLCMCAYIHIFHVRSHRGAHRTGCNTAVPKHFGARTPEEEKRLSVGPLTLYRPYSCSTSRTRTASGARCASRRVRHRTRSRPCFLARIRRCGVCTRQDRVCALSFTYGHGKLVYGGLELQQHAWCALRGAWRLQWRWACDAVCDRRAMR